MTVVDPELEELKKQFIISDELEELLEIRFILSTIYKDRTVFLKEERKINHPVLVIDLSTYPLIWCDECKKEVTFEAIGTARWIYITCDLCNKEIIYLRGNHK